MGWLLKKLLIIKAIKAVGLSINVGILGPLKQKIKLILWEVGVKNLGRISVVIERLPDFEHHHGQEISICQISLNLEGGILASKLAQGIQDATVAAGLILGEQIVAAEVWRDSVLDAIENAWTLACRVPIWGIELGGIPGSSRCSCFDDLLEKDHVQLHGLEGVTQLFLVVIGVIIAVSVDSNEFDIDAGIFLSEFLLEVRVGLLDFVDWIHANCDIHSVTDVA